MSAAVRRDCCFPRHDRFRVVGSRVLRAEALHGYRCTCAPCFVAPGTHGPVAPAAALRRDQNVTAPCCAPRHPAPYRVDVLAVACGITSAYCILHACVVAAVVRVPATPARRAADPPDRATDPRRGPAAERGAFRGSEPESGPYTAGRCLLQPIDIVHARTTGANGPNAPV